MLCCIILYIIIAYYIISNNVMPCFNISYYIILYDDALHSIILHPVLVYDTRLSL